MHPSPVHIEKIQMTQFSKPLLAVTLSAVLFAGSSFSIQAKEPQSHQLTPVQIQAATTGTKPMTMEQAMAHQDWLGRQPEESHWSLDSQQVYFERKREGSELRDWYSRPLADAGNGTLVPLSQLHQIGSAQISYNADRSMQAYVFEGDVFVRGTVWAPPKID